ncbi:MAG: glycoside hydrolase family 30 beta sandwich domain-containing protein [Gemmatimonadales bacterium]
MTYFRVFAATVLAACTAQPPATTTIVPTPTSRIQTPVAVWLTTGDRRVLLGRQDSITLGYNETHSGQPTIEVDESKSYQQMIGFGAAMTDASAYLIQNKLSAADREALLQDLFGRDGGIGMSFIRVPMGASDFSLRHYSYDDMPAGQADSALTHFSIDADRAEKLPLLRRALAINPDLKLMASPWSPPGWMKTTNSLIKGTLQPKFLDSFASYFVKFIRAYEREGVPVYAISLQNEPNFEPDSYPGMKLEPKMRARVIGGSMGPAFARAGINTLIWDYDHNWDLPQQPLDVLADTAAARYTQGVAWHCYGGDVSAQSTVHDAHPDKDTYFTECSGGEWAPKFADNLKWTVNTLVIGATRNWARGVLLWNLALDENHGPHLGGCDNCRGIVTINSKTGAITRNDEYYALAHASKFVRPGARRIASESGDSTLSGVAFKNADGSKVLIVLNTGEKDQLFTTRWRLTKSPTQSLESESLHYNLAAGSVVTFTWK